MWIGHLLLHRVEALVARPESSTLEPFDSLLLSALQLMDTAGTEHLDRHLNVGKQVLGRLLPGLQDRGLVQKLESGWSLTETGRQALAAGTYDHDLTERRTFYFLEREDRPPHFLHLDPTQLTAWPAGQDWNFSVASLQECIAQPGEWKALHGFPTDVTHLLQLNGDAAVQTEDWQRVIIDQPMRQTVAMVLPTAKNSLVGFAVQEDGWKLQHHQPIFTLAAWQDVFPDLANEPDLPARQAAWQAWCHTYSLPTEPDLPEWSAAGARLRLQPSKPVRDSLRKRKDLLEREAWMLVGSDRIRQAFMLEFALES